MHEWKIAFTNMDVNTVMIIVEKNATEFKVFQLKIFV